MADAIVSVVAERIIAMVEEQIQSEVALVRGVDEEVLKLSDKLTRLRNVLNDAENRRFKDKNINYWLSRLEQTSYEMEDVLDEWNYALLKYKMDQSNDAVFAPPKQKVCSFIPSSSCLYFKKVVVHRDIAKKIKNVRERLDQILKEKDQFNFITSQPTTNPSPESWRVQSTSLIDLGNVLGRDKDKDILVSKLICDGGGEEELGNLQVVSIVGVGGLGKTTLAQLVYSDSRVKECFELRIWICVSDPFDLAIIAKGILESLDNGSYSNTNQLDVLFKHVQDSISGKRFLLVLDDVWNEDGSKWEPLENSLKCGCLGSKVLVTTRNERVAKIARTVHVYRPGQLSDEDCWLVLRRMALFGKNNELFENFEYIGKKIAKKCKGLPLAAKTLGSLLCFKNTLEEWENVLNSEIWKMKEARVDLFPHLLLSYNELSPTLKRCFSYCAVFRKDKTIYVDKLIRNWMALGYLGSEGDMEVKGREYFDILAMHSLFQDFVKDVSDGRIIYCKMHDIVHDFALFLRKSGRVEGIALSKTTCRACVDPLLVSTVNEFRSLFWKHKESPPNFCDCLTCLRVLSLSSCELPSIPTRVENLIHLRLLNLNENALSHEDLKIIFELYNMQTLSLSNCGLEEISKEIKNLIHLRYLDLSRNKSLKKLPIEIGDLIHLRHLNLSNNESLKELPRKIGNLIHLRHLDLSYNESLMELPREIGNLIHLRHLNLRWIKYLKELPKEIGDLIHLRHFDLSSNESLKELPKEIGDLIHLRHLDLSWNKSLNELPNEIGDLIHLRHLDLSWNESLKELPKKIGNLVHLTHLNLSSNKSLKELPREIGNLIHLTHLNLNSSNSLKYLPRETGNLIRLRHLYLRGMDSLKELPESICALKLRTLDVQHCNNLSRLPEGVGQLTSLGRLGEFHGGSGGNQLRTLKNLNNLSGSLMLRIRLDKDINSEEMVEDAKEAQLRNKTGIEKLEIWFEDEMDENEDSSLVRMNVIDAFEPHPKLEELKIWEYKGSQLPGWLVSPFNQLRKLFLSDHYHLTSLPPLRKLSCLEDLSISWMSGLEFVGREFLGIGRGGDTVAFPKLKELNFMGCSNWKEWEDITTEEEEESAAMTLMPCLTLLQIRFCEALTGLPHCLLRKVSSLQVLDISESELLEQRYGNKDGSDWKSISRINSRLQLKFSTNEDPQ